ncbi:D123-domain-containing protein [Suillus tomentosus]|nr:D123-domain-containing protein [Suillus tomentosus]
MSSHRIFPLQTPDYLLSFQFSSWYPTFSSISIKSAIIRFLSQAFKEYLNSDGIFVPLCSLPTASPAESSHSDQEDGDDAAVGQSFSSPDLDEQKTNHRIIRRHGNFPQAQFFFTKVRKWYPVDWSREFRCFVREGRLIGISQRDTNFYDFMNEPQTQNKIVETLQRFWEDKIKSDWHGQQDYVFDVSMTHPLLFTYEELLSVFTQGSGTPGLRIIDSFFHAVVSRNAPAYQHNMLPMEALVLSSGQDIKDFSYLWKNEIQQSMNDDD